jgi:hypothetical protein
MDIHQLIQQKREQIAKLQAQIEVLEELASEVGTRRGRRAGTQGRKVAGGRRGRRAGRGANQQRVLSVLTATPTRASEIARSAGISQQGTTQVLKALIGKGLAAKTGRGLYKASGDSAARPSESSESRVPRAAKAKTTASRKPRRSLQPVQDADSHHAEEVASTHEEPWAAVSS